MNEEQPLVPARALLHPAWIGSLVVLALNDHLWKGGDLLPAALTGKLSDVAGLIVAPVVLAVLLQTRGRRAWTWVHLAIGLVFAAIQLVPAASHGWSALMGGLGIGWHTTMDATDLFALPALLVSHRAFLPVMQTQARTSARPSLEYTAAGLGLLCCVATSPIDEGGPRSMLTDVYIHNSGDEAVVIRVRELAAGVVVDCDEVAADPGRLLREDVFGPAESWSLRPDGNHGLDSLAEDDSCPWTEDDECDEPDLCDPGTDRVDCGGDPPVEQTPSACRALWFDADSVAPAVLFWIQGDPALHRVGGEGFDPEDRGAIELSFDDKGNGRYGTGEEFVFVPVTEPPTEGACAPQSDATRLDWSTVPAGALWTVTAVTEGLDGCWGVDLGSLGAEPDSGGERWHVCAPLTDFPFVPGDGVEIEAASGGDDWEGLVVSLYTPGDAAEPATELHLTRGASVPQIRGLEFAVVPDFGCGFAPDDVCGTVARAASVTVGGGVYNAATLEPGATPAMLEGSDGSTMQVLLSHAQDRVVLDPSCAEGPAVLGHDLEITAVYQETSP